MSNNEWRTLPPETCPYCGEPTGKLPDHLPCDAVPTTEEVLNA